MTDWTGRRDLPAVEVLFVQQVTTPLSLRSFNGKLGTLQFPEKKIFIFPSTSILFFGLNMTYSSLVVYRVFEYFKYYVVLTQWRPK